MRIAVIGAGWAGLAAAIDLTTAGQQVTVFEAGRVPGGRARTVQLDGHTLDNGQHLLLGAYRQTLALMAYIGIQPKQVLHRTPLHFRNNTGFKLALPNWPTPLNLAWGLLTAHGLSWADKRQAARWMQSLKTTGFQLDHDLPVTDWLAQAGQSKTLCAALWEPLCLAALNTPPHIASAQRFANVLRDSLGSPQRGDTDLLFTARPLGEIFAEPACTWLAQHGAQLRLQHRVRHIESQAGCVTVDGENFDHVVLAVAPQHVSALWPDVSVPTQFEPIATVYLQYPYNTRLPSRLYGLQGGIGQWVIDRGNGWFAGIFSGVGAWQGLDNATLCQTLVAELQLPAPLSQFVIREQRATYSCQVGYRSPAQGPSNGSEHSPCWLAGDYTDHEYPATLEGAIRSGRRAAKMILQFDLNKKETR